MRPSQAPGHQSLGAFSAYIQTYMQGMFSNIMLESKCSVYTFVVRLNICLVVRFQLDFSKRRESSLALILGSGISERNLEKLVVRAGPERASESDSDSDVPLSVTLSPPRRDSAKIYAL